MFRSALIGWLTCAAAYDNGAPNSKLPPMGWSSWVALGKGWPGPDAEHPIFDFCDEGSVKSSIDAFHEVGLYDAGYRHFHLDDCWADVKRNATGYLQAELDHFPNGMVPIVDYAHSRGLTFGLYTCAGTFTCVGGRPGSKGYFDQDAAVMAEWGVDVVKMDWCNTDGMKPEETYPLMANALNKTGRPIHFNMCEWGKDAPWHWGPNVAQSWRFAYDHTGIWSSTKSIIMQRTLVPDGESGAPYAWNDMDMLETGNYKQAAHANGKESNMTASEYKTEFSMWAIFASPLVVTTPILNCSTGTCVASITDLQKEILFNREVIAINQDVTQPGKLLAPETFFSDGINVFGRMLSDGSAAVAILNAGDQEKASDAFNFSLLGWTQETTASVRNLWSHEDLGVWHGQVPEFNVEAHATLVLRLTPVADSSITI
eukprot:TRINITY_DN7577_c0_g1_i1.p1 TRINITY_DN7577_c0_g1~~TRINITY_DN7577_c0_g1_i1.p1  ORF type:complete len:428 (-),score=69.80 TRINITY_DN7577_c0_g1_i1:100-1383(-)